MTTPKIAPMLWFDGQAEDATNYYLSLFPGAEAGSTNRMAPDANGQPGRVISTSFRIGGQQFLCLNGGPQFRFNEAISFLIPCETQSEIDYYWDRLTADGGKEGQCGWLTDKFGLSWQVVPAQLERLLSSKDPQQAQRSMRAMMGMKKLDIAQLEAAAAGE